jgi:hypothetical protein
MGREGDILMKSALLALALVASFASAQLNVVGHRRTVYSGTPQAAAPTFSPAAGAVTNPTTVTASTSTSGCGSYIYFDTSNPPTTNQTTYTVTTAVTLYAYVHGCPGYTDSSVSSASYTISGSTAPVFHGFVSGPLTSSTPTASVSTTTALAVTSGDLVIATCASNNTTVTGFTPSGSGSWSGSWNSGPFQANGSEYFQAFWAVAGTTGSFTFTCTPSASSGYQSAVAMDYTGSGLGTSNIFNSYTQSSNTTFTSGTWSTSQRALIVFCGLTGANARTFTAGSIGGSSATQRAATGGSNAGNTGCEDLTASGSLSSATASIAINTASSWAGSVLAINY